MIKAFFLSAFRPIQRKKAYSLLNLLSLSLGLTSLLAVILYVNHELSYDDFHLNPENTYRIVGKGDSGWLPFLSRPYSEAVLNEESILDIQTAARVRKMRAGFIKYSDRKIVEDKILATDPGSDFFKIFNYPLSEGQADEALLHPNSVIIFNKCCQKIFW